MADHDNLPQALRESLAIADKAMTYHHLRLNPLMARLLSAPAEDEEELESIDEDEDDDAQPLDVTMPSAVARTSSPD